MHYFQNNRCLNRPLSERKTGKEKTLQAGGNEQEETIILLLCDSPTFGSDRFWNFKTLLLDGLLKIAGVNNIDLGFSRKLKWLDNEA